MWWLYPACFIFIAGLWVWVLLTEPIHWLSAGLGFATGMMLAYWGVETFPGPYKSPPKK